MHENNKPKHEQPKILLTQPPPRHGVSPRLQAAIPVRPSNPTDHKPAQSKIPKSETRLSFHQCLLRVQ